MSLISPDLIRETVHRRKEEILEWTKTLIRFPSENRPPDGYEKEAQEFIRKEYITLGWDTDSFSPADVSHILEHPSWLSGRNYTGGRNNVVATWKGKGTECGTPLSCDFAHYGDTGNMPGVILGPRGIIFMHQMNGF